MMHALSDIATNTYVDEKSTDGHVHVVFLAYNGICWSGLVCKGCDNGGDEKTCGQDMGKHEYEG